MAVCSSSGGKTDIPPQWLAYDGDTVREALRRIRYTLETRLPDHTLPSLLSSRGVITDAEVHIVSGGSNPILKNRLLLDILMGKDTRVILQFFAMLKSHPDLTGYSELVEAFDSNMRSMQPKKRILQNSLGIQKLLATKQARLEEIKFILQFRKNKRVHDYSSLELNSQALPNSEKTSDSSANALHSLAEERDLLTQLCAYLREQLRLQENEWTSDSEDESMCTSDSAHPKRGNKTKGPPIHRPCYNVQEMPWYWGSMDKEKSPAEDVLMSYPTGSFLVRDSTHVPGSYALAIRKEEGVITYLILDQNGLYGFMDSSILQFPTVVDLVDFCCHYSTLGPLKEGVAKDKHDDHKMMSLQQALDDALKENALLKEENTLLKKKLEGFKQEGPASASKMLPVLASLVPTPSDEVGSE